MTPRFRLQLATKGRGIAALAVLVGVVLLLAGTYVFAVPPVEEPTEERVDTQRFTATVGDRVTVERETPLYQPGAVLENHPAYFTNTADNITLTGAVSVPANRSVSVTYRLTLRAFADRADETVWTNETLLVAGERTVTDGEIGFEETVDVVALSDYLFRVEEITQTVAGIRTQVVLEATYSTVSTTGEPYEGTLDVTRELRIVDNAYWVEGEASATNTESVTIQGDPVTGERDTESALFLFGGGLFLLLLARGVDSYRRTLPPTTALARAAERAAYAEWISAGEHVFAPRATYVEMDSLGDLANLAIDANRRIIHDETDRVYVVTLGDQRYYWLEPERVIGNEGHPAPDEDKAPAGDQPNRLVGGRFVPIAWVDRVDGCVVRHREGVRTRWNHVRRRAHHLAAREQAATLEGPKTNLYPVEEAVTTLFEWLRRRAQSSDSRERRVSRSMHEWAGHHIERVASVGRAGLARASEVLGQARRLVVDRTRGLAGGTPDGEVAESDEGVDERSENEPARESGASAPTSSEPTDSSRESSGEQPRETPDLRERIGDERAASQTAASGRERSTPTPSAPDSASPRGDTSSASGAVADGSGCSKGTSRREQPPTVIRGIGQRYSAKLADAGVTTVGQLAAADTAVLSGQTGVSSSRIERWIEAARTHCDGAGRGHTQSRVTDDASAGRTPCEDAPGRMTGEDAAGSSS
jgi:predicted flap endonuclease-1-like 5' DNA nuclease